MSKYPKTLAAAGRESKGLKDLAAALWNEIPAGKRGASQEEATVQLNLEEAQIELAEAGYDYAVSRLKLLRVVAGFVAEGKSCEITTFPWRDVPFSVHEEAYRSKFSLARLDGLIAEDERVTVDVIRTLVGKKQTRPPKTTAQQDIVAATPEEGREIIESILDTKEGRKALIETVVEKPEIVKAVSRRREVVAPKAKKTNLPLDDWSDWSDTQKKEFDSDTVKAVRHILNAQLLRQRGYEPSADAAMHLELIRPSDLDADYEALVAEVNK